VSIDLETSKNKLQKMFQGVLEFQSSNEFADWVNSLARFRRFSPFNAALIRIQRKGAGFVATEREWADHGYRLKPSASPIVILKPFGPVDFVYDELDVEKDPASQGQSEGLDELKNDDAGLSERASEIFANIRAHALKQYRVRVLFRTDGSLQYGELRPNRGKQRVRRAAAKGGRTQIEEIATSFDIVVNEKLGYQERVVALVHELGHLLCGHLDTRPSARGGHASRQRRNGLTHEEKEFEAESVAFLFCSWHDLDSQSERYLATIAGHGELPRIDLHLVLAVAGKLSKMAEKTLPIEIIDELD